MSFRSACAERSVESEAVAGRENLLCVGGADGGYHVGAHDAAFEEVQTVVEFEAEVIEVIPSEPGPVEISLVEVALVADIVNGEDGACAAELLIAGIERGAEVDAAERGVPVVRVQDVGSETEVDGELHCGAAEEDVALGVVGVFASVPVIELRTVEETVVFDEVPGQIFMGAENIDARPFAAVAEGDAEELVNLVEFEAEFAHLLRVERHNRFFDRPKLYDGMTTETWCPRSASARGSAAETSASPPVFAYGTASLVTQRIFMEKSFLCYRDFICSRAFRSVSISSSVRLLMPVLESLSRMRSSSSCETGPLFL